MRMGENMINDRTQEVTRMNLLGTLVNTGAVLLGGGIGLLAQKGLPKRLSDILFQALGLCTIYIGVSGALSGENTLILILCMVLGTLIGEGIDLDLRVNQLGGWIERRFSQKNQKGVSLAEGFVHGKSAFAAVGAMSIVGALQSGLSGSHEMLYTKSLLDFVSAIIFASTLGAGVLFSALFVLVYQGQHYTAGGVGCPAAFRCRGSRDDMRRLCHHHWAGAQYDRREQVESHELCAGDFSAYAVLSVFREGEGDVETNFVLWRFQYLGLRRANWPALCGRCAVDGRPAKPFGPRIYSRLEEGQNGRTTVFADPVEGSKSGLAYLEPCLETANPLDLVILMLGTNDAKDRFGLNAYQISGSAKRLAEVILRHDYAPYPRPELLLISPIEMDAAILAENDDQNFSQASAERAQNFQIFSRSGRVSWGVIF